MLHPRNVTLCSQRATIGVQLSNACGGAKITKGKLHLLTI